MRADEQTTREAVVTAVVDQPLLILRALARREAANARVALAQRLYEQATELKKTGIGLKNDTARANVELQNERQNLIDAEAMTHTTKYRLANFSICLATRTSKSPTVSISMTFPYSKKRSCSTRR